MAAWSDHDFRADRDEALGQAREADGDTVEAFYPAWLQPEHVERELRAVLEPLGAIVSMFKDAA